MYYVLEKGVCENLAFQANAFVKKTALVQDFQPLLWLCLLRYKKNKTIFFYLTSVHFVLLV